MIENRITRMLDDEASADHVPPSVQPFVPPPPAGVPDEGLYAYRCPDHSPQLGRWMDRDPAGYIDGLTAYPFVPPPGDFDPAVGDDDRT